MREALRGKTIGRILINERLERHFSTLYGNVLDLAGGVQPSYLRYIPQTVSLTRSNRAASADTIEVDFNKMLPFDDASFDAVLIINAIYIADDPLGLLADVKRVLKRGGRCIMTSPLIANEMKEPHDYVRFTDEGFQRLCNDAGFATCVVERVGERFSAAAYLLQPFFVFNIVRALIFPIAALLDGVIPKRIRLLHPAPIAYIIECTG